ncbi:VanZ family protein [Streptomyces sp. SID8352]|uniref:VanZ family protein n=1 Tax=Streptomyces sp. SID8352 TaxID=2690338 RepID=UPI0013710645|nr:VanZ family protein [Streptomyces sp. SID8352]
MQREWFTGGGAAFRIRATGSALLVAHLALVAWFTLRPRDVPWVPPPNLHPFATIRADLAAGWPSAARSIGGGLVPLAPLGVLLPVVSGRLAVSPLMSLLRTTAAGALLALGVELLRTGVPGQVVDVDSALLATLGVTLAHLALVPAGRARLRRWSERERERARAVRREERPQGRTPRIPRVGIAP